MSGTRTGGAGEFFTVYRGTDRTLTLRCVDAQSGNPRDLTTATEISVSFLGVNGPVKKTMSGGDVLMTVPLAGRFSVKLGAADTTRLQLLDRGDIEAEIITPAEGISVARFTRSIRVLSRL
jgi:hypothetical protein